MTIDRRGFMAIGGGLVTAAFAREVQARKSAKPKATDEWAEFRSLFELDGSYVHMTGLLLASHPKPVRDAIEKLRAEFDRNPVDTLHHGEGKYEPVIRAAAARFLGGTPEDIALTGSTTIGLGTLYGGFRLQRGQEILATTEDHYSTLEALRFRGLRDGTPLKIVTLYDKTAAEVTADSLVARILAGVTPRTRLLAVTWVHTKTGIKLPVRQLADAVAALNRRRDAKQQIILSVDGVHGFGVENVKASDLGCDFFVAGCHKWLFGPRGTGLIWGKPTAWQHTMRTVPPFEEKPFVEWLQGKEPSMQPGGINMSPGGFHAFEHRWALAAAFELQEKLGRDRIQAHIHQLNTQCKEGLKPMKHVTLHTPMSPDLSSGIVCFEVAGMKPDDVVKKLHDKRIIASSSPYRPSYARVTPGLLNTPGDVDTVLKAIRELA